jgi:hypothetical protein
MIVGIRLELPVAKVTSTEATHNRKPTAKVRNHGRRVRRLVPATLVVPGVVVAGVVVAGIAPPSPVNEVIWSPLWPDPRGEARGDPFNQAFARAGLSRHSHRPFRLPVGWYPGDPKKDQRGGAAA